MTQLHLGLDLSTKRTRKREFLDEMRRVVPWSRLIALIEPHYPKGKTGRPPFPVATMLQIHFLQQWFGLSDPAMEEALYDIPLYREFAGLDGAMTRLPDETTILRFRHLLETDRDGGVVTFLEQALSTLAGGERAGIAFVLAEHYRKTGHLTLLQNLYALDDPQVKGAVLNGLWGEPGASPEMGPGIVALAIEGAAHLIPGVRTEACYVFQNLSAWRVDVTAALGPLLLLLDDPEWRYLKVREIILGRV